jgi:hypothetical protein
LRAVLSHLAAYEHIELLWDGGLVHPLDSVRQLGDKNTHFRELFEPLTGVQFIEGHVGAHITHGICDKAPPDWRKHYASLRPLPALAARIASVRAGLGPEYLAVHVRRTDMVPLARRLGNAVTSDEEYQAWVAQQPADLPIWLASDNGETQRKFRSWYGSRVRYLAPLGGLESAEEHDHRVYSPIEDGVVDMYVAAQATHFCGAGNLGSFTHTIQILHLIHHGLPVPDIGGWP